MFQLALIGLVSLLSSMTVYGQTPCEGQKISYAQVLKCVEERSPAIQSALLEMERANANVGAAGQWRNPELGLESFQGKVLSQSTSETDLTLAVPIEPGKIGARLRVANSGIRVAEALLYEARATVRSEVMLKLHRLRQLLHEQEILDESISTFAKLVSQYSRRPKLSPEQELSTTVFRLAKSDYDLRKATLNEELATLDSFFKLRTGRTVETLIPSLPSAPKSWPKIEGSGSVEHSPRIRQLSAELEVANAEVSLARSESWPTVSVGPSVKLVNEGGRADQLYGVNLSLPLPLFNANGAGRRAAQAGAKVSETKKSFGLLEEENRRAELVRIYDQSVAALNSTQSHPEIEKRHHEAERQFMRGLVPSSLVIEAHRTFVDLEQSRHQRELRAIEAWLGIYTLDGQILEKSL
ncbi:MAG: TolC family protein [Bdellovibrionales bacterium]